MQNRHKAISISNHLSLLQLAKVTLASAASLQSTLENMIASLGKYYFAMYILDPRVWVWHYEAYLDTGCYLIGIDII